MKRTKIAQRTADRTLRTFELYFIPFIGSRPISEISKQEYIDLVLRMSHLLTISTIIKKNPI